MKIKRDYRSFDIFLVLLVLGLCIFGLIIIPSAGQGLGISADRFRMQKVWIITGVFVMLAAAFIDYDFICKFYIPIYAINILLLIAVLVMKKISGNSLLREIGYISSNGDTRITIMPSEFAKIFMIIFLSKFIDKNQEKHNHPLIVGLICVFTFIPFVLIFEQPALSASIIILLIMIVLLYASKLSYKYFIVAAIILIPAITFLYYDLHSNPHILIDKILEPYQIEKRLLPFFNPEADPEKLYQTNQSKIAISSGQLFGNGLFNNEVSVPESTNDFIFAIVGSEFGFLGCVTVLAVGFLIVIKCLLTAWRSQIFLGKLIASGVAGMLGFHMILNVGISTGFLPNTGITFPFLSSGGSSIWISMACIGLVLNVGMTKTKNMFED